MNLKHRHNHISSDCKFKFDGRKSNPNKKCNNDICQLSVRM